MEENLRLRIKELLTKFKLEEKRKLVRELTAESEHPDFWKNHAVAAQKMKQLASLSKEIAEVESLERLLAGEKEEEARQILDELELALFLSGTYDRGDAILSLHAGQGGTEAMDWTEMLLRMYRRYIERKGWAMAEIDRTAGEEAGIKSVTLEVSGAYAYGFLKAEAGVHRLVRQSPFNADHLRQTSFAMVEVLPIITEEAAPQIKEEDLEWEFFRSGGRGGQNVNKVSTAVRLRHKPTGLVVTSQAQRYQGQNREAALTVLRAKLWARQAEEARQKQSELKGEYKTPGWGNQIRSYVLHPYHLVKDLRTGYETNDTTRVLDGDIEDFITAYLKKVA